MKKAAADMTLTTPFSLLIKAKKLKIIPTSKRISPSNTTGSIMSAAAQLIAFPER